MSTTWNAIHYEADDEVVLRGNLLNSDTVVVRVDIGSSAISIFIDPTDATLTQFADGLHELASDLYVVRDGLRDQAVEKIAQQDEETYQDLCYDDYLAAEEYNHYHAAREVNW